MPPTPTPSTTSHLVPPSFTSLKSRILTSLSSSSSSSSYTDASPKGSLDTAIIPLINRLNTLEGAVTTSSCAGRVTVFLEGRRKENGRRVEGGSEEGTERDGGDNEDEDGDGHVHGGGQRRRKKKTTKSVPGGKGLGGRWLFVSHDPVEVTEEEGEPLTRLFGLSRKRNDDTSRGVDRNTSRQQHARSVRFAFEPMILHIATASLAHASPILSAAISAGFRESGVQSLKNLTDHNALTMVAVRSAGLGFESIIGVVDDTSPTSTGSADGEMDEQQPEEIVEAQVEERYLEMLVEIAKERFVANTERMRRFEDLLFRKERKKEDSWEDKRIRQERKRMQGLRRQEDLRAEKNCPEPSSEDVEEDEDVILGDLEGIP